ncbi:MAG: adenylate cyclase [Gammaproteobacteria bacterium]|nr:adenylate cyclase [Gammaproteobacteria bacterium]
MFNRNKIREILDALIIVFYVIKNKINLAIIKIIGIDNWHLLALRKLSKNILVKSKLYKNKNFSDIPIINKAIHMENFDLINTVGINKNRAFEVAKQAEVTRNFTPMLNNITIGLSSGTSGNRGIFLVSNKERLRWAGIILSKILFQSFFDVFKSNKIAFFLRANSNLYTSLGKSKKIQFRFYDLFQEFSEHIKNLNIYKPDIIVAPPNVLLLLAQAKLDNLLNINPKKIISVADVLDPKDSLHLQQVFGQIIHQIYQCTEGFLATTCKNGTLHLNEDLIFFEKDWLDQEKTKFSPIITDLTRTSQPIIRYKLDDILTLNLDGCDCGNPCTVIRSIDGRCDDMLYFKHKDDTNKLVKIFPDFIRNIIIQASEQITEYQVTQKALDKIEIQIKSKIDNNREFDNLKLLLNQFLEKQGCLLPNSNLIEFQEKNISDKLRRIRRDFVVTS